MKRTTKLTAITAALVASLTLAGPIASASAGTNGTEPVAAPTEQGNDVTWIPTGGSVSGSGSSGSNTDTKTVANNDSDVLAAHNVERHAKGLKALSMDAMIERYANRHSREMAEKGYLYHTSSLAGVLGNKNWTIAGENVGVGGSAQDVMDAFMKSPDHRRNILRSTYTRAGVGVYTDKDGLVWITVVFYG